MCRICPSPSPKCSARPGLTIPHQANTLTLPTATSTTKTARVTGAFPQSHSPSRTWSGPGSNMEEVPYVIFFIFTQKSAAATAQTGTAMDRQTQAQVREKPWSIVRTHLEHGAVSLGLGLGVGRERPLVNLVRVGGGRPLVVVRRGHVGVLQFLHFISFQHDKFIINTIVNHTSSKKTSHREQTRYFVSHVSVKDIKQVCKQVIVNKYTYVHLAQKNRA